MNRKNCLLPAFLFLILTQPALGWAWSGEVVGVTNGDIITVLNSKTLKDVKIRLYGIATPEKGQRFHKRARQNSFPFFLYCITSFSQAEK